MIKLVISNQRGGVAKTTTATTLARLWADRGRKVLLIDTDPQGSVGMSLGLKADKFLHHFVVYNHLFESCLVHATPNIDVLCSSRETIQAEASLMGVPAREMSFSLLFSKVDEPYDIVIIDVAPSITLMQTCAMVYAQRVLIPVSMDTLSLQGRRRLSGDGADDERALSRQCAARRPPAGNGGSALSTHRRDDEVPGGSLGQVQNPPAPGDPDRCDSGQVRPRAPVPGGLRLQV